MRLRIISGILGGRFLDIEKAAEKFRPTSQRVREAVASALSDRCHGASVADICAGSGAFGFEMLSRGAKSVDFVELDSRRASVLLRNAAEMGVSSKCRVVRSDVRRFMADNNSPYDIIYYDPPYSDDNLAILIPEIAACIAENGILVVEHDSKREAAQAGKLEKYSIKTRYYGDSAISYISR